jgi:hypothetical protein
MPPRPNLQEVSITFKTRSNRDPNSFAPQVKKVRDIHVEFVRLI